jgi:CheY-like chemotaxis protein/HAMP domain-containing protein
MQVKVSIRLLLSLALIALTAFPLVMLGLWAQQTTFEREYSRVHDKHLLIAKNITLALDRYILDTKSVFTLLCNSAENQGVLKNITSLAANLNFVAFRVEKNTGEPAISRTFRKTRPIAIPDKVSRVAGASAPDGDILIHPVTLDQSGTPRIYLSKKTPDGQVAIATIGLDYIEQLQSMIKFGSSGHSAIVDHTGNLMAHPVREWVMENKNLSHLAPVQELVQGKSGVTEFFSPATQTDMITGYSASTLSGWGVMIPQALSELKETAANILRQLWLVLFVGIILTAVFAWWLAGWLISPLKKITDTAIRMNSGELSARVLPFVTVPADEFRELGVAFDQMAQSLQDNNAQLQIKLEKKKLEELQAGDDTKSLGKVLVVDDSATNTLTITGWLSKAGYTTFSALNNAESLKIASVIQPDLAIVSVVSSSGDGFKSKRKLINLLEDVKIPVIAIYPALFDDDKIEELEINAVVSLKYPLDEEKLLTLLTLVRGVGEVGQWSNLDIRFQ